MTFTETPDTFLADLGKPVVWGSVSGLGILDMPDQQAGEFGISTEYVLTVKTATFQGVKTGDTLTVDGTSYKAKQPRKVDDGVFMLIPLKKS